MAHAHNMCKAWRSVNEPGLSEEENSNVHAVINQSAKQALISQHLQAQEADQYTFRSVFLRNIGNKSENVQVRFKTYSLY